MMTHQWYAVSLASIIDKRAKLASLRDYRENWERFWAYVKAQGF